MSFSIFNSKIVLCSSNTVLAYNTNEETIETINLPQLSTDKVIKQHNNAEIDAFHGITSVAFSPDGEYFCICTNRKQLCLYKTENHTLISNRTLIRAASQVRFTPESDVIVADKSGDVYLFSTCDPDKPGDLILGHLSMLLDALVTEDNRYVVTTDRDEKIRVSHFPNAYNIESYCLGHTAFVSNVAQLPHNKDILVSAGGDGTVRFWRYVEGEELKSVNFMEHIQDDHVKKLNENLQDLELINVVKDLPVKHLRLETLEDNQSIIILSFYEFGILLVYTVSEGLDVNFLQTISEDAEPLECLLLNRKLWVLFDTGIKVYSFDKTFVLDTKINDSLEKLNVTWKELRPRTSTQLFYPTLYKRKYDTHQEYHERKKSRLSSNA